MLSTRMQRIKPSPTLTLMARAKELKRQGKDIINLSVGEPDFTTPSHISDAAIKAIQNNITKYTPSDGLPELKQAIADKFQRENNLCYQQSEMIASAGAKLCLYNALQVIINRDDEVIIPAPYWVSYPDLVQLADGIPVIINTDINNSCKLTADELQNAITHKTRAIILNSPANPSGAVYSNEELLALAEILIQHPEITIISDDIYEHIIWEKPFLNIVNICPELKTRTIVINGVSKAYAMTGWRIGYAAGPSEIISAMKIMQSQSISCPNSIAQIAATAALNGGQECIIEMTNAYKKRYNYLENELTKIPEIKPLPSQGTFYNFPNISELLTKLHLKNDVELTEELLNKTGLVLIPGSAFGTPNHVRISFAVHMNTLEAAMQRLTTFIESA